MSLSALEATGAVVRSDAPLQRLAYWRVGGPAQWLVEVSTLEQLQGVMRLAGEGLPVTVLGKGSNALISDAGVPGAVLRLRGALAGLELDGPRALAGAGLLLTVLIKRLDDAGLAGAEPFAGVPGTVGGAVVMNAGTRLGEAKDLVESVTVALPGGALRELSAEALQFAYRHATLPPGAVVALARLRLSEEDVEARREARQDLLERRKATQPLNLPSCGSTFTNPPGDYAGRLIEAAGLKGHRVGGASISEKHANFIVNHGEATAEDIRALIALARVTVRERFGVWMQPEVRLLGAWSPDALERP
ncbi:MAG: UDP-N-acetylmuramate dehydrogenase [Alphaproteobacteria bacterium]|nr:UDP-N-acetylmuramate dehydrogenase [Alphaproteobacteria bacterium]MCB9796866.1 UDP-N-acetylmuramate dehydrogenase [Alphaproteobacteria bacterium]